MQEFIDTLSRELDYNAYALRSLAQLFCSPQTVEAHEFASYTIYGPTPISRHRVD
jgi:hypothetical protein|tara:strand:- start:106 stop:270 length:165 start_codon:yes stop_codon:yes gene_type:complete